MIKRLQTFIITTLALMVVMPIAQPITVNAKAKVVIAQKKSQFKKGYKYTYNKKKHVYIGKKGKKVKYEDPNKYYPYLCAEKPIYKIKPIKDITKNTPKVDNFGPVILNNYYLTGYRFAKNTITYQCNNANQSEQNIINDAITQINDLGIVKLTPVNTNADINININNDPIDVNDDLTNDLGVTYSYFKWSQKYHGLTLTLNADIELNKVAIKDHSSIQPQEEDLVMNSVIIHEIGHALGLAHVPFAIEKDIIMNPACNPTTISSYDRKHTLIDQYYKNGLAILYKN